MKKLIAQAALVAGSAVVAVALAGTAQASGWGSLPGHNASGTPCDQTTDAHHCEGNGNVPGLDVPVTTAPVLTYVPPAPTFLPAQVAPQCTPANPFPYSNQAICTGYNSACPRMVCAYAPGTPGHYDINGRYEPRDY